MDVLSTSRWMPSLEASLPCDRADLTHWKPSPRNHAGIWLASRRAQGGFPHGGAEGGFAELANGLHPGAPVLPLLVPLVGVRRGAKGLEGGLKPAQALTHLLGGDRSCGTVGVKGYQEIWVQRKGPVTQWPPR